MTAIKINPARLPYRGEPTRDRKPSTSIPQDAVIVKVKKTAIKINLPHTRAFRIKNRSTMWTKEQEQTAYEMWDNGKPIEEIAKAVNRSAAAVDKRLWTICKNRGADRIRRRANIYTADEIAELIRLHNAGKDAQEISERLGRSFDSVKHKICRLKKSGYMIKDHRKGK